METILKIWELDHIKQFVEENALTETPTEANVVQATTIATSDSFSLNKSSYYKHGRCQRDRSDWWSVGEINQWETQKAPQETALWLATIITLKKLLLKSNIV